MLKQPPAAANAYTAAVVQARRRVRKVKAGDLPEVTLRLEDQPIDVDRLADYGRVCGFSLTGVLPPTFLNVLTMPLQLQLITAARFPLTALGLVHVSNEMVGLRPVEVTERVTLTAWAADLAPHRKGVTVDLQGEARVADELVWQGRSHYLARGVDWVGPEPAGDSGLVTTELSAVERVRDAPVAEWKLPADLGRRYAAVSGDVNPIHLSALSARAFGFKRAIAHGMWLHARSLAALKSLPDSYQATVEFRRPVPLPSTVTVLANPTGAATRVIELHEKDKLKVRTVVRPHG